MLEKNEWCFHQLEGHPSVPACYQKLGEENLLFLLSTLVFRQNVFAEELKIGFFNLKVEHIKICRWKRGKQF